MKKKVGAGDLLDGRIVIPKIMKQLNCDREKAKKVFLAIRWKENQRVPDFDKLLDDTFTNLLPESTNSIENSGRLNANDNQKR